MKKAAIVVCGVIYFIAIIVVAFLGYRAEIMNPPVYADDIVLVQSVPYTRVENGVEIYTIKETALESQETYLHQYDVHITDFEFMYYVLDAKLNIEAKPISFKVNEETGVQKEPDEKKLNYYVTDKNYSVSKEGIISFDTFDYDGSFDCIISTVDGSNKFINVHIHW